VNGSEPDRGCPWTIGFILLSYVALAAIAARHRSTGRGCSESITTGRASGRQSGTVGTRGRKLSSSIPRWSCKGNSGPL
jgi:hypothetical protein